jgi:hypothetical protein
LENKRAEQVLLGGGGRGNYICNCKKDKIKFKKEI